MNIGQNIQFYRKKKGLSQKELAEKMGKSTGTIQQYELNKREPKFEIMCEIAKLLDVKTYQLYGDDVPEDYDPTEHDFSIACEWLEMAGFEINPPDENDGLQEYYIDSFNRGTICKMDKINIINTIQPLINEANEIRDNVLIGYIRKSIIDEP